MKEKEVFGTAGYAEKATILFAQYENFDMAESLKPVVGFFPAKPSQILDIGAGTGALAAWFAGHGHNVVAVEPVRQFREPARLAHPERNICFIDDSLPDLKAIAQQNQRFDLITLNAVWMHLDAKRRETAMGNISSLLRYGGRVFISLRHGIVPQGRQMFQISPTETVELASRHGLVKIHQSQTESIQAENRKNGVTWTKLLFESQA